MQRRCAIQHCATALVALALSGAHLAASAAPASIVWAGKLVIAPGTALRAQQSIVLRNGLVEQIVNGQATAQSLGLPADTAIVDASNLTVLPGLMDLHVHLTTDPGPNGGLDEVTKTPADLALLAAHHAQETVEAGFTTVLDMGTNRRNHESAIYAVRDAIRDGQLIGPRILSVGSALCAPGQCRTQRHAPEVERALPSQGLCSGVEDCRREVREQVSRGADVIAVFNTGSLLASQSPPQPLTDAEMRAIVDSAHALHRRVVADGAGTARSASGINAAIAAGVDWVDTAIYADAATWKGLAERKILYAPHLYAVVAAVGDSPQSLDTGSMGWLPPPILQALWALKQQPPAAIEARRHNIPMAFASDAGVFAHGRNAHEFMEYVRVGLTPEQAIATATTNAAAALGLSRDSGSIEVGKRADLIGVPGDPLTDVRALLDVDLVVAAGRLIKRPDSH